MILSKCYDPADLLQPAFKYPIRRVDEAWDGSQHTARRWEYAMALQALNEWEIENGPAQIAYDIGGAGSPFHKMLRGSAVEIIDPNINVPLARAVQLHQRLADCVFCISVIEHVEDLDRFLYHLGCLVQPGGLLFLTTDYQQFEGPDDKHFHWMRKRIFNPYQLGLAAGAILKRDFAPFGDLDYTWHQEIEAGWGYTFASMAFIKRP